MVTSIFFNGDWRGWTLLFAATPVVLAASAALAWLNRILVEPLRSRVRRPSGASRLPTVMVLGESLPGLGAVAETNAN